jgi:hypothetical protein
MELGKRKKSSSSAFDYFSSFDEDDFDFDCLEGHFADNVKARIRNGISYSHIMRSFAAVGIRAILGVW